MITPGDLSLAQRLLAEGRMDAATLGRLLAEAAEGPALSELLAREGLTGAPRPEAPVEGRTLVRGSGREATRVPATQAPPGVARTIGKYQILEEVARGGMGVVYRALDPALGRTVALKVMLAGSIAGPDQIARFQREARAAAGLSHPNIIQVFEVGRDGDVHFIAMEFVDGIAADRLLRVEKPIPIRKALRIARDVARALDHAHRNGIVHRDIKPGNILLTGPEVRGGDDASDFRVLLGDFGLARDTTATSGLTMSGDLVGTPAYMSPEQAWGRASTLDGRSDIYSLGAVLYELISGKVPFPGSSIGDVLNAIQSAEPRPLGRMRPGLHRDVAVIVHHALRKDPARRYATAGEFADDLDRFLRGEPTVAQPPARSERAARWARRHVAGIVTVGVVMAVAALGAGLRVHGAVRARADEQSRLATEAREHRERIRSLFREARKAAEAGRWDDALTKAATARRAAPGDPEVEAEARDLRLLRVLARHRQLVAEASPDWGRAKAHLDAASEFREHPDVRAAMRLVEGTGVWSVETREPGVDVDLGADEPGIYWDEETFPGIEEARVRGLCVPVGRAPIPPTDIGFGRHMLVFSRDGRVLRVLPLVVERSASVVLEHARVRVGPSADADHATLEAAFAAVRPGATILLEPGSHAAPPRAAPPGVLIAPFSGPVSVVGGGIPVSPGAGPTIRDITLPDAGSSVAGEHVVRPSLIRVRLNSPGSGVIDFNHCFDILLRDCETVGQSSHALGLGTEGALLIGVTSTGGRWTNTIFTGRGHKVIRCRFENGERAGLASFGKDLEAVESTFRNHGEWSIIAQGHDRVIIRDCLFIEGIANVITANPGVIVVSGIQEGEVVHNTFVGGQGVGICAGSGGVRITDNIICDFRTDDRVAGPYPGTAFYLMTGRPYPVIDRNLIWNCENLVTTPRGRRFPTVAALHAAPPDGFPAEWRPMSAGLHAAPGFRDASAGDYRLAEDSPARGAGAGGADLGVRWAALEADRSSSADRQRRENGRVWLARAGEALEREDRVTAARLLDLAAWLAPGEPGIQDLRSRLK